MVRFLNKLAGLKDDDEQAITGIRNKGGSLADEEGGEAEQEKDWLDEKKLAATSAVRT